MRKLPTAVLSLCIFAVNPGLASENYLDLAEVRSFIDDFSKRHQYPKSSLTTLIGNVKKQVRVLDAIQRPAEKKKNWREYREIFVTAKRINEGLQFWAQNAVILEAAEKRFGIPPEIIVAIIGVETFYGRYKGVYPVLDSLVTLGFEYEPRKKFFRSELEHFLLLTKEEALDPSTIKGSYAGAMGKSQFISSSYRRYAVDFDENGKRDLWDSNADAIGSVANYLKEHGWQMDQPVTFPVTVEGDRYKALLKKGLKPAAPVVELSHYGVKLRDDLPVKEGEVALLEFKKDNSTEYWVGLNNFYVITRYNHSSMYAMAVYQLSQQVKQGFKDYVAQN